MVVSSKKFGGQERGTRKERLSRKARTRERTLLNSFFGGAALSLNKHSRIPPASQRDVAITPEHLDLLIFFSPCS